MPQPSALARVALTAALIAACLLPAPAPAPAQEKTFSLKFSSWVPPAHGMHPTIKEWGESISRATNGTVKVTLYPAQQLGKADDHYDMARDGIAEVTYIALGYQAGRLPMGEGINLPFLMTNADGGSRAVDEWYRTYHVKEMTDVKMCLAFVRRLGAEDGSPARGGRGLSHVRHPGRGHRAGDRTGLRGAPDGPASPRQSRRAGALRAAARGRGAARPDGDRGGDPRHAGVGVAGGRGNRGHLP